MSARCILENCWVLRGHGCELGSPDHTKCKNFRVDRSDSLDTPSSGNTEVLDSAGERLPWSGRALGTSDLGLAASRGPTDLVALVGPYNAGKTTFLTSMFAHFALTGEIGSYRFAGSWSLEAWDNLRRCTEWPNPSGPSFPPHTPDTGDRVPGLLHLALREDGMRIRDFLFTDAPGEWFTRWIQNQSADNITGAQWISDHATSFLLFVDREALAGPMVGKVRADLVALSRLLAENRRGRPISMIWAKSDIALDPEIEAPLRERLNTLLVNSTSYDVSITNETSLEVLMSLVEDHPSSATRRECSDLFVSGSTFLAYRSKYAQ